MFCSIFYLNQGETEILVMIQIPQIPAFLGDSDTVSDLVKISNFVSDFELFFFNSIPFHPWDPIKLLLSFGHIYSIWEKVRKRTIRDKEKEGLRKKTRSRIRDGYLIIDR